MELWRERDEARASALWKAQSELAELKGEIAGSAT
jgi:hypothetical protein